MLYFVFAVADESAFAVGAAEVPAAAPAAFGCSVLIY